MSMDIAQRLALFPTLVLVCVRSVIRPLTATALAEPNLNRHEDSIPPCTWFTVVGNNDCSWRVDTPAKALGAKVIKIRQETGAAELNAPNLDGNFRWYMTEDGDAVYPDLEGECAVWTRPDQTRAIHAIAMADQGIRMVAEVDDNYLAPAKFNPFMRQHYRAATYDEIKRAYAPFDHIIVTTDWLRDSYRKQLKDFGVKPLPAFHVCGNHIDPADWPDPEPYDGPVRIGWMGSDSHFRDVKLAYPAMKLAYDHGCHVVLIGYDPRWRPGQITGRNLERTAGFEYEYVGWTDPKDWKRSAFPIDIGLAPLERNVFTLGKSDIKVIDYAMSGAAVVASDTVYGKTIKHEQTGLIGSSQAEIAYQTMRLVRDPKMRHELAANLRQYILENRVITQPENLRPWKEAIDVT